MSTTTTRNTAAPSGVVEYVITDDARLSTARVVHTIGGVTIEHDGFTVYLPMTMVPAALAAIGHAVNPRSDDDPEPSAFIVRCERNEAERVTRDKFHAATLAAGCACGGEHAIRPSSVAWVAGTF